MTAASADPVAALLADPRLWRGNACFVTPARVASGYPLLDEALGGGWPLGVVCELALEDTGSGELLLLLPVLRQVKGTIALIRAPHVPYPPAFAAAGVALDQLLLIDPPDPDDALWAAEQTLRSGACAAVLLWLPRVAARAVRRLQLEAEIGGAFMALLLPKSGSSAQSPAALRLQVEPTPKGVAVRVCKRRGGWPGAAVILEYPTGVVAGHRVAAIAARSPVSGG